MFYQSVGLFDVEYAVSSSAEAFDNRLDEILYFLPGEVWKAPDRVVGGVQLVRPANELELDDDHGYPWLRRI